MRSPQAAHVGLERRLRRALAHDREHDVGLRHEGDRPLRPATPAIATGPRCPSASRRTGRPTPARRGAPTAPRAVAPPTRPPSRGSSTMRDRGTPRSSQAIVPCRGRSATRGRPAERANGSARRGTDRRRAAPRSARGRPPPLGRRPCSPSTNGTRRHEPRAPRVRSGRPAGDRSAPPRRPGASARSAPSTRLPGGRSRSSPGAPAIPALRSNDVDHTRATLHALMTFPGHQAPGADLDTRGRSSAAR